MNYITRHLLLGEVMDAVRLRGGGRQRWKQTAAWRGCEREREGESMSIHYVVTYHIYINSFWCDIKLHISN